MNFIHTDTTAIVWLRTADVTVGGLSLDTHEVKIVINLLRPFTEVKFKIAGRYGSCSVNMYIKRV